MRSILSKLTTSPSIPHFRLVFPVRTRISEALLAAITKVSQKSPAMFISINGFSEKPVFINTLHDTIRMTCENKKVPVYTFLEDNVDGLAYYVATAGQHIAANPFCKIGELGVPVKTYRNIKKLLQYFGIEVERLGLGKKLFDPLGQVNQQEKQFSNKWLQVISEKLQDNITKTRNLPKECVSHLSHMMSPNKALELRLIDKVTTVEEFAQHHFPNNKIVEQRFFSGSRNPNMTRKELDVLVQISEWMVMPKMVLMSMEDPVKHITDGIIEIISGRLGDPEKLEQLDAFLGNVIESVEVKMSEFNL